KFTVHSTDVDGDTLTFDTDATKGSLDSDTGAYSWKTASGDAREYTWYFKTMDNYGGVDTETIVVTVDPAPLPVPPAPVNLDVTQGNFWIEYTWKPGTGTKTDSYKLKVNGVSSTTSLTSRRDTVEPHGSSEITVWAYNNSGGQSLNSVSRSTQVQNNKPVQSSIGNKNVLEGDTLKFTVHSTDVDGDTLTFDTDATKGSLDSDTGAYSWKTTSGDAGEYTWYFKTMDNYGGVDTETIVVTVDPAPLPVPPAPES
ncbi:MAG TPA: hypothetical protein VKL21_03665, partial [Candidatus Methanoperedens sp.]|nr:hypothetical protein [Candidatus Methanoperedens sp.]